MYSSSRKRCPKTKWALKLLTAAFLAAVDLAETSKIDVYDDEEPAGDSSSSIDD